jgi:hypothetical protein
MFIANLLEHQEEKNISKKRMRSPGIEPGAIANDIFFPNFLTLFEGGSDERWQATILPLNHKRFLKAGDVLDGER